MFPAAFDYRSPASLDEALAVLAERGDDAKVMAGGQSLIPLLKLRFAQPALVLDIGRLPNLNAVTRHDGNMIIGALVRHVDIERDRDLTRAVPLLAEAAHWIADPLVRNRGTVVGSVCHADPSGDWGSVMLALNAVCRPRCTKTRTTSFLYAALPRMSSLGSAASAARRAASRITSSLGSRSASAFSASIALMLVAPTDVRPMPALAIFLPFISTWTATATVAKSPTFRSSLL